MRLTYVSSTGTNTGSCSTPATACQSFGYAVGQTVSGGEIDCVDASFYQLDFTLSQSVTFDCAGGSVFGWMIVSGPGIVFRLRHLTLSNNNLGGIAIDVQNLAALYIENRFITNYDHFDVSV